MTEARYPGWCAICGQAIDVGEYLGKDDADNRWKHLRCIEEREALEREQRREIGRQHYARVMREAELARRLPAPAREALTATDRRFAQLLGELDPGRVDACPARFTGTPARAFTARCKRCGGLGADHLRGVA